MIPDSAVPSLSWCKGRGRGEEEVDEHELGEMEEDPVSGRGQILWVRGLTRLQQQVGLGVVASPALIVICYCRSPSPSHPHFHDYTSAGDDRIWTPHLKQATPLLEVLRLGVNFLCVVVCSHEVFRITWLCLVSV